MGSLQEFKDSLGCFGSFIVNFFKYMALAAGYITLVVSAAWFIEYVIRYGG